jgi:alpha-glucosidase
MHNVPIPPECVQDPFEKNVPGLGLGRDPARTPMQWSAAQNASFTSGKSWLPIAEDYTTVNVEAQMRDPHSILNLNRRLIELRRREPALAIGHYIAVPASGDVLAYRRQYHDTRRYLVVLNFASTATTFQSSAVPQLGTIELSTYMDREKENVRSVLELRPNEGVIVELTSS